MGVTWGRGRGRPREGDKEREGIRMSFLSSIKKVLNIGQTEKKKKVVLQNIKVCTYILHLRSKYCLIVLFPTLNLSAIKL